MTALLILIPVALFLGALGLAAFLWSMKSGQFEDLDGAAARILNDDEMGGDALEYDEEGHEVGIVDPRRNAPDKDEGRAGKQ
jgi:cbb3-type cytochrome oxidase maturation protein